MKQKDILLILGSLCVSTIAWVIFNVYHNTVTSTIPETVTIEVRPISPEFDTKIISQLKQRQKVNPVFSLPNSPSITPVSSPTPTPSSKNTLNATASSILQ